MRWQLVTFGVLPVGEALLTVRRVTWRRTCGQLVLFGSGATLGFAPQLIAWRLVYGQWLVAPVTITHHWSRPDFWAVLFTTNRGLFYWTPITALACVGFAFSRRRTPLAMLGLAFVAQVYALASIRGTYVDLGASFGYRYLTEACVALAPGLALMLEHAPRQWNHRLAIVGCGLVGWNLLLIDQYRHFITPPEAGASPGELLAGLWQLTHRRPVEAIACSAVSVMLTWLALRSTAGPASSNSSLLAGPKSRAA
jgi:hypothetical protein